MITNLINTTHDYDHYYIEVKFVSRVTVWHLVIQSSDPRDRLLYLFLTFV